jgi:hypothetical protein
MSLMLPTVAAQQVDDATKNAARELAQRGSQAFEAGDYASAQDLFHRAHALIGAPTLSLREARALVKLGRLVEAIEAYVRSVRTKLGPDAPKPYQDAVAAAEGELEQLRPRVPQLKVVVEGLAKGDRLTVTIDGKPLQAALIGVASPVDPGTHEVVASTSSGAQAKTSVTLAEGESKDTLLRLEGSTSPRLEPASAAEAKAEPVTADTGTSSGTQRTLGFIALGVGVAGIGTGVGTGLLATDKHKSAENRCPDNDCEAGSAGADDLHAFRQLRTISTIGYAVGVVGAGAGIALLLTAPSDSERAALFRPYVGFGAAGVFGEF